MELPLVGPFELFPEPPGVPLLIPEPEEPDTPGPPLPPELPELLFTVPGVWADTPLAFWHTPLPSKLYCTPLMVAVVLSLIHI